LEGEMMDKLEEKAKTLPEWHVEVRKKGEKDCGCCSSIGTKDACSDCAVILDFHPKFIEVSVAQQEIDEHGKNNEALAKVCSDLNDTIERLERERGVLKQRLQEHVKRLVQLIPSEDKILRYDEETEESWLVVTADPEQWRGFQDRLVKWFLELKELLK
jgi:FtsZ-binding cell division protein ZapB